MKLNKKKRKKTFCGGICKVWNRSNNKCCVCGLYVCGICEVKYGKKTYCINCFIEDFNIMDELEREFKDMVYQLKELTIKEEKRKCQLNVKLEKNLDLDLGK